MKKVNLLSKAEMKKVVGGDEPINCDDWRTKEWTTCWACCMSIHPQDYCLQDTNCGPFVVIHG